MARFNIASGFLARDPRLIEEVFAGVWEKSADHRRRGNYERKICARRLPAWAPAARPSASPWESVIAVEIFAAAVGACRLLPLAKGYVTKLPILY